MTREVEAKFRVHAPFRLPDLVDPEVGIASVDGPRMVRLTAVYHDTADLRLAREGVTLRHRSGGDDGGWHLKLPVSAASAGGRPKAALATERDELTAAGPAEQAPEELRNLVQVWVRTAPLLPVATLVTDRAVRVLRRGDGTPLAELVDDTVSVLDQGHPMARFREIEVEDVGGGSRLLGDLSGKLQAAGAVGGEFTPKVIRALGPPATRPPDPPPPGQVGRDDPGREVLAALLRGQVRALMAHDVRVRRREPDAVHQMRVVSRRLRALLRVFDPLLDPVWTEQVRGELAWLADRLGDARDAEVLLRRLQSALDLLDPTDVRGPVRARLNQRLLGRQLAADQGVSQTLADDRYLALVDRLVAGALAPPTLPEAEQPARGCLPPLVRGAWRSLRRRARLLDPAAPGDGAAWHRTRIAAKRLRYASEAVAPVFGRPAVRLAEQAERIHDLLGEHQDAVVAAAELRRMVGGLRSPAVGYTVGLLTAGQDAAAATARAAFRGLWADAARRRHRRWLAG